MVCLLMCLSFAWAQERAITGKVTDAESNTGIPGVSVFVKGTNIGTVTDTEGRFSINVSSSSAILVFQSVGLVTQEVPIGNNSTLNVQLTSDTKLLNEVVVTGYGTQEKRDVTGSISQVKGADISNLATASFDQQLAGRAAGVNVNTPNGLLGQAPRIRIRGTNSITSDASPLVVIDNVPMVSGNINISGTAPSLNALADINPSDIESMEVLKDGSATAIYGSRAANGVILITTKKGKQGSARVNYDGWFGTANTFRRLEVLGAQDYITISNEKYTNAGQAAFAFPINNPDGSLVDTDWQEQIFRRGFVQNHALTLSGGTEKTTYLFSGGWTDQKGAIVSNQLKRATFRANIDQKVSKKISVGMNMGLTRTENIGLNTGNNSLSGNVAAALSLPTNVPVFSSTHPTGYNISPDFVALGRGNNTLGVENNGPNIRYVLDNNKETFLNYRVLGNFYAQVMPIEGLTLRTQYGIDAILGEGFTYWNPTHGDGRGPGGLVSQSKLNNFRWNWQNTASYSKTFAEAHKVDVVIGLEYQKQTSKFTLATATALSDPFFGEDNIITGTFATQNISGDSNPSGFDSYFGRINYSFKDKYLMSFSVRNDGISDLPKANRRGTFLGGSVGWRLSEETFFKNMEFLSFISDFKIRGSYAQVGNVGIGNFPYLGSYGAAQYASQNGSGYAQAGNNDLKWETSSKYDAGVDFGLFNDRIRVSFDYYRNDIDGLILFAPAPFSLGIPGNGVSKNIGGLTNSGIEMQIGADVLRKGDFSWSTDFNFSTNKNRVTATNNNQDIISTFNITRVGEPIGTLYGFRFAGVNPSNGNPLFYRGDGVTIIQGNPATGGWLSYNPVNPNEAGVPLANGLSAATDRVLLGQTNPAWFGGWSNTFRYKGFDLQIFMRFSGGNYIMNITRQNMFEQNRINNTVDILNRWTTPGQITDVPRLYANAGNLINQNNATNSRFVEKGDFLRMQNIVLGYNFTKNTLDKLGLGIRSLRLYAQVQNVFIVSKYKGFDPELNLNSVASNFNTGAGQTRANTEVGLDHNGNPQQRMFTFGINLGF